MFEFLHWLDTADAASVGLALGLAIHVIWGSSDFTRNGLRRWKGARYVRTVRGLTWRLDSPQGPGPEAFKRYLHQREQYPLKQIPGVRLMWWNWLGKLHLAGREL